MSRNPASAARPHPRQLSGCLGHVIATARRIQKRAGLSEEVPVVIFCIESIDEGAEVNIGGNVYLTRPDNFNQLRDLLRRILHKPLAGLSLPAA